MLCKQSKHTHVVWNAKGGLCVWYAFVLGSLDCCIKCSTLFTNTSETVKIRLGVAAKHLVLTSFL